MIRYEYEKFEDFRRTLRDAKIKRAYYRIEYSRQDANTYLADFRVTAIGAEEHFTFFERVTTLLLTQERHQEQRAEFEAKITEHKNKFLDLVRETMPDTVLLAGIVYP